MYYYFPVQQEQVKRLGSALHPSQPHVFDSTSLFNDLLRESFFSCAHSYSWSIYCALPIVILSTASISTHNDPASNLSSASIGACERGVFHFLHFRWYFWWYFREYGYHRRPCWNPRRSGFRSHRQWWNMPCRLSSFILKLSK